MALKPQPQATSNILKGNPNNWVQAWAEYWASLDLTVRTNNTTLANLVTTVAGLGGGGVQGSFKNLSIAVASTTTVAVAADFVVVSDGTNFRQVAISATCDLSTNGAVNKLDAGSIAIDTWYFIWVIAKAGGATPGTLASTSPTAPTLPAGYTMKARIGAVQTIHATPTLYGTLQLGRRAQYVVGLASTANLPPVPLASGSSGNPTVGPSFTTIPLTRIVPTTASVVHLTLNIGSTTGATVIVAPNNSYGIVTSTTNPAPFALNQATGGSLQSNMPFNLLLESNNIFYASSNATNALFAVGWEDNLN